MIVRILIAVMSLVMMAGCAGTDGRHKTARDTRQNVGQADEALITFCHHVTSHIKQTYHTLPKSYQPLLPEQVQSDEGRAQNGPFVELTHIPSYYEVLFQHQGEEAVFDYCLERHQAHTLG